MRVVYILGRLEEYVSVPSKEAAPAVIRPMHHLRVDSVTLMPEDTLQLDPTSRLSGSLDLMKPVRHPPPLGVSPPNNSSKLTFLNGLTLVFVRTKGT